MLLLITSYCGYMLYCRKRWSGSRRHTAVVRT